MAKPDQNSVLRQLPFIVGGLGGTLLLINRLLTPQLTESQARSDALGGDSECHIDFDRFAVAASAAAIARCGRFGWGGGL